MNCLCLSNLALHTWVYEQKPDSKSQLYGLVGIVGPAVMAVGVVLGVTGNGLGLAAEGKIEQTPVLT